MYLMARQWVGAVVLKKKKLEYISPPIKKKKYNIEKNQ